MASNDRSRFTRRTALQAVAGLAATAGLASTANAQGSPKLAKSVVMYQDHPNGANECSKCVNFEPPNACKIVEGTISPHGWCGAFAPKSA